MSGILILAGIAYAAGGPWMLWAALIASAVGDLFLAGKPERWLLPGMGAFFLAHVFYVVLFWQLGEGTGSGWPVKIAQAALVFGGAFYIRWLVPWIDAKMRVPVIVYGAVILMMGAAAIALPSVYGLVVAGALMFIASDSILAHQLFYRPVDAPPSKAASYAVWFLYFFGQAAITFGLIGIPA
ncbi:MAG: lysoplasmalogenase [Hyphomonas sp.]|jgi:uncharacterized membrane protein YhhN|nr:lysoplasmalogenase [Hyphomonas sp.]